MPIQRQYSLPDCVLTLDGLSNSTESAAGNRPELSVLTRFECYFAGEKAPLVGGRELLDSLIGATNTCVQASISGVQSALKADDSKVQLQPAKEGGGFDLRVPAALLFQGTSAFSSTEEGLEKPAVELHISAVQLFDLMEAVDQLTADQQTLPELQVAIQPRSRRDVMSTQLVLEQSAPIALGAASVAVAAAAVFFIPAPKVQSPPKELQTQPSTSQTLSPAAAPPRANPSNSGSPTATPSQSVTSAPTPATSPQTSP
jgi:hypothetical protein